MEPRHYREGVTVAVLDTGVDITHPDLQDNIWTNTGETNCTDGIDNDGNGYIDDCHGWDMGGNGNGVGDNDPVGSIFHGTHVAGIIAAEKNGTGAVGVAPDAKIMPLKIFDDNGFATTENFMEAMEYAWRNGADIASISLGRNDVCAELEQTAINKAFSAGVFIVASSGNEDTQHGMDLPFSNAPAVCENVFATGATNAEKIEHHTQTIVMAIIWSMPLFPVEKEITLLPVHSPVVDTEHPLELLWQHHTQQDLLLCFYRKNGNFSSTNENSSL